MLRFFYILTFIISFSHYAYAGLDVYAYSSLRIVNNPQIDSDGYPIDLENEVVFFIGSFKEQFDGLKEKTVYRFKSKYDFRAGSYSYYNNWRNELARLAGYKPKNVLINGKYENRYDQYAWDEKSGDFWELINFSDVEGSFGPKACKKLYKDFVKYHKRAMTFSDDNFRQTYINFEKAFSIGSKNGAVAFE